MKKCILVNKAWHINDSFFNCNKLTIKITVTEARWLIGRPSVSYSVPGGTGVSISARDNNNNNNVYFS